MKRQTSEPLTANHASKLLFQELPDEVLEQISGGDGRFPKLDDDLKEIDWDKLLAKAKEAEKQFNQSPLLVGIIID